MRKFPAISRRHCQLLTGLALLAGLLLITPVAQAQDPVSPTDAMMAGNQSYETGEYRTAAEIYESIIAAGIHDSRVYYNLGNAYFKAGDIGRAILNYRRAERLAPRDSDISNNLAIARAQTLDKLEQPDEGIFSNLVQAAEEWLTLHEAAILALVLWLILSVFAVVAILSKRFRKISLWIVAILGLFLIIGIMSMGSRYYRGSQYLSGVIVAQKVNVTSGPGSSDQYLVEFELHSGAEVVQMESRPGWRRIALPGNDFQGWVPEEAIGIVQSLE